jgi:hypothetical protein
MLVVALAASGGATALADMSAASKAVWDRHVQAATAGDLDAVMEDFTEASVIITAAGPIKGKAAIRAFFEDFFAAVPEDAGAFVVNREIVHDRVIVYNFSGAGRTFHDTAIVEDGKIAILSTVDYPATE